MELEGKRVTVMGLGTRGGGVGAARFLAEQGAVVTATDGKSATDLEEALLELDGLPIRFVLGSHDERDFTPEGADIVLRNPAVRRWSPYLQLARESGVPVEMEMTLFFRLCPAPIIGITGSKGKTSTSAMIAAMLSAWRPDTKLLGNMGISAVGSLADIESDTPVVIELSSWQLEGLDEHCLAPHIGLLTNIVEDHLDTYDSFEEYAEVKRTIARHMAPADVFIVNRDDPLVWKATGATAAQVVPVSGLHQEGGVSVQDGRISWSFADDSGEIVIPDSYALEGEYQQHNAAMATAAALERGADPESIHRGLSTYSGVADRRELVATIGGVQFVNDSSATAPAATIAVLKSFAGKRIHLIAGGSDKHVPLDGLADAVANGVHTVTLLDGTASEPLRQLLTDRSVNPIGPVGTMEQAVRTAAQNAQAGDVVLLSPGCASFGLFQDEFDRGRQFRAFVRTLEDAREVSRS